MGKGIWAVIQQNGFAPIDLATPPRITRLPKTRSQVLPGDSLLILAVGLDGYGIVDFIPELG